MAQVKIEDVVYRREGEFKKALADVYHLINGPDVSVSLRNSSRWPDPVLCTSAYESRLLC